ncbi:MAG: Rnf-Nqr domain containing protein, partial [Rhodocyclaceae bacterium]
MMGIGFVWVIGLLGAIREFIGQGTLLSGIEMIVPGAHALRILPESYPGFLIMILPPGAFFALGLLIAGRNWLDHRANERAKARLLAQRATPSSASA